MALKLKNNTFVNVGTGVSAPESYPIEAEGNKAFNVGKMFDIRKDKKIKIGFVDRSINQTHNGVGDNVAGNKTNITNEKEKDIPLWLKYLGAVVAVVVGIWTLYPVLQKLFS